MARTKNPHDNALIFSAKNISPKTAKKLKKAWSQITKKHPGITISTLTSISKEVENGKESQKAIENK